MVNEWHGKWGFGGVRGERDDFGLRWLERESFREYVGDGPNLVGLMA